MATTAVQAPRQYERMSSGSYSGSFLKHPECGGVFFWRGFNGGKGPDPKFCPNCGKPTIETTLCREPSPEQPTKANWQIGEDPAASWDNP